MKLNSSQISQLFDFTKQHYVDHYDVQVEIVDHLASAIEQEMAANHSLTFDEALQRVFGGFGIFGFGEFVSAKVEQVQKAGFRAFWSSFLNYFTWPKLLIFIGYFGFFYGFGLLVGVEVAKVTVFGVLFLMITILFVVDRKVKKSMLKSLTQIERSNILLIFAGAFVSLVNLLMNGKYFENLIHWNVTGVSILSAFIVVTYLAQIDTIKRNVARLKEEYPAAFVN